MAPLATYPKCSRCKRYGIGGVHALERDGIKTGLLCMSCALEQIIELERECNTCEQTPLNNAVHQENKRLNARLHEKEEEIKELGEDFEAHKEIDNAIHKWGQSQGIVKVTAKLNTAKKKPREAVCEHRYDKTTLVDGGHIEEMCDKDDEICQGEDCPDSPRRDG